MSRTRRTIGAVVCTAALLAVSAGAANAAPAQRSLPGSVPSWANAAQRAGSVTGSASVTFRVYLDYSDAAGAAAYAMSVSTKGSANYGKYLTPGQFTAKFAPTQGSVNAVSSWLKGQGFAVGDVPANRKYVEATGTLDQAAAAFGTSFAEYTVSGKTVRGNTKPLVVPASLSMVEGVVGLDESQTLAVAHKVSAPPPGFRNATPCSLYWGEKTVTNTPVSGVTLPAPPDAWAPCGYAGAQLQGVYGVDSILADGNVNTGQDVTIGVIDAYASPTIVSDTNTYFGNHGLPAWETGQFTEVVPKGIYNKPTSKAQDPSGWAGEETLDIEAVHTMAPGANVVYYGAPNNYRDMDALMNRVVMANKVDIVTNSYGYGGEALPMGTIKPSLDTQIQAAAQGISLFFSSGDSGDETGGVAGARPSPDWPASSPWVTAVGGTSVGISQDNTRVFELGWETGRSTLATGPAWTNPPTYLYGSGGGTSRLFAQPSYQAGIVPDEMSTTYGGAKMRVVPDVSAIGDPTTGMLVGETQAFSGGVKYDEYRIGGTSLSSPIYAGIFALAVKASGRYGLANPALYAAGVAAYDVTKADLTTYPGAVRSDFANGESASGGYLYTARWFDADQFLTIHVASGYDDVTGVGSPNGSAWFNAVVNYKKS